MVLTEVLVEVDVERRQYGGVVGSVGEGGSGVAIDSVSKNVSKRPVSIIRRERLIRGGAGRLPAHGQPAHGIGGLRRLALVGAILPIAPTGPVEGLVVQRIVHPTGDDVDPPVGPGRRGRCGAQATAERLPSTPGRPIESVLIQLAIAARGKDVEVVRSPGRDRRPGAHVGGDPLPVMPGAVIHHVVQGVVDPAGEDIDAAAAPGHDGGIGIQPPAQKLPSAPAAVKRVLIQGVVLAGGEDIELAAPLTRGSGRGAERPAKPCPRTPIDELQRDLIPEVG